MALVPTAVDLCTGVPTSSSGLQSLQVEYALVGNVVSGGCGSPVPGVRHLLDDSGYEWPIQLNTAVGDTSNVRSNCLPMCPGLVRIPD